MKKIFPFSCKCFVRYITWNKAKGYHIYLAKETLEFEDLQR